MDRSRPAHPRRPHPPPASPRAPPSPLEGGVPAHLGYLLQIGDGTPQGWGASIQCPRASYQPQGLAPGQKVAFRVAVQRKSGVSLWSDALVATVR